VLEVVAPEKGPGAPKTETERTMKKSYRIRTAESHDLQEVMGLLRLCRLPCEGLDADSLKSFCVAESGGKIAGTAGIEVHGAFGLLRSVTVAPAWRNRALGEILVKDRLAFAGSRGLSAVFLLTLDAGPFFERFGFTPVGREAVPPEIRASFEFCDLCPESATAMMRALEGTERAAGPRGRSEDGGEGGPGEDA
jgi:amino-acid N-acetyltransferase